jgi:hypothetical protein
MKKRPCIVTFGGASPFKKNDIIIAQSNSLCMRVSKVWTKNWRRSFLEWLGFKLPPIGTIKCSAL